MADAQIAIIDGDPTQIAVIEGDQTQVVLAPGENPAIVTAIPGPQGPAGAVAAAIDGSAALPSIAFASDTDTGLYRVGANQLGVSTGGTQRLVIDASGQIEATSLGTAAAPTWTFVGDPNTGIYSPGADQLALSTNGNGRLFIDASGQVGVNSAPRSAFGLNIAPVVGQNNALMALIAGANTAVSRLDFGDPDAADVGRITYNHAVNELELRTNGGPGVFVDSSGNIAFGNGGTSDNNTFIGHPSADTLTATTNGSERLRITSAGLVGIGTSAPATSLEVNATTTSDVIRIDKTTTDTNTIGNALSIYTRTSGTAAAGLGSRIQFVTENVNGTVYDTAHISAGISTNAPANKSGFLAFSTAEGTNNSTERVRIDSSGRVGIGTASPGALFHSSASNNGPTTVGLFENTSTGAAAYTNIQLKAGTNTALIGLGSSGTATGNLYIGNDQNKDLDLYTGSANIKFQIASTERLRIDSSGRLLVGTSSARANFTSGTRTSSFQVEGTTLNNSAISILRNSNDTGQSAIYLAKSRSTVVGDATPDIVADGDSLGSIFFQGADNTNFVNSSSITAQIDGTNISSTSMPGRLVFSTTADGAATPTERLRITAAGRVGIGTTSPDVKTTIVGTALTKSWSADANDFFAVENSSTATIDIRSGITASGNILFSDGDARQRGRIEYSHTSDELRFGTAGTSSRVVVDSSGRLLVGTSSTSAGSTFVLQGNTASSGIGIISLANTGSSPVNGEALGVIRFTSNTHNAAAAILAARDAGTWTSGSSEPTRLTFFTTSDASASPTERLRITSAGVLQVADAGNIAVGTTTGTKIGTATTQKLGFFNKTPVVQPAAVADATDAASVITQLNALLARMRDLGLIAT